MDTFMDKLAQKFTAQEMIKANSAAEAAELQRMRDQVKQYNDCLQEMKLVNADTKDTLVQMEKALAAGVEKFEKTEIPTDGLNGLVECSMARIMELQQDTEAIQTNMKEQLDSKCAEITDFVHKENVKVYRNVQAVVVEEFSKQNAILEEKLTVINKKQRSVLRVAVTSMIFSLIAVGALAVQLLIMFGII